MKERKGMELKARISFRFSFLYNTGQSLITLPHSRCARILVYMESVPFDFQIDRVVVTTSERKHCIRANLWLSQYLFPRKTYLLSGLF